MTDAEYLGVGDLFMVAKCVNPGCTNLFRYLHNGRLFLIDHNRSAPALDDDFRESGRKGEYFWLCNECARTMTITTDRNGYVFLVPRAAKSDETAVLVETS